MRDFVKMPARKYGNMEGLKMGRLTVIKELDRKVENNGRLSRNLLCTCDCGNIAETRLSAFVKGASCGCAQIEAVKKIRRANPHGQSKNRIYRIHSNMMKRCYREKNHNFKDYGGRGIKVCERWHKFNNFFEDMSPTYEETLTLDRINNAGNYEKSNCKWVTITEQANNRRSSRFIECDGKVLTAAQWAKVSPVQQGCICTRIKNGYSTHDAIFLPPMQ